MLYESIYSTVNVGVREIYGNAPGKSIMNRCVPKALTHLSSTSINHPSPNFPKQLHCHVQSDRKARACEKNESREQSDGCRAGRWVSCLQAIGCA
jgi:hypothetical protein